MAYGKYIQHLTKRGEALIQSIAARYNFDLGDEFEIVLCEFLSTLLPGRFGVCRGFIVASDNSTAGDDIIIYDRHKFPTLRLLPQGRYERKEEIPADAVYAYIEAKHTLYLNEPIVCGQSFAKAVEQIRSVRELHRKPVRPTGRFIKTVTENGVMIPEPDRECPDRSNPWYACIIARHVRATQADKSEVTDEQLAASIDRLKANEVPDLVVAGASLLGCPVLRKDEKWLIHSPFFIEGVSSYACLRVEETAFAVGHCALLNALEWIQLASIDWPAVLNDEVRGGIGTVVTFD